MTIALNQRGSRLVESVRGSQYINRFTATDIVAGTPAGAYAAIISQLPSMGAAAPAPLVNLYLEEKLVERVFKERNGPNWLGLGQIVYRTPTSASGALGTPDDDGDGLTVSYQQAIETIDSPLDRAGNQITTSFDNYTMAHTVARTVSVETFTVTRLESTHPRARKAAHQDTLNASAWNGYAAETVRLVDMQYETPDRGQNWLVTYSFAVRASWKFTVFHEDPLFPGNPLPGATVQNGQAAEVELYATSNFSALSITLP